MGILAECPRCHKRQAVKRKQCFCGLDLDVEKKGKRVKYHIVYRVNGKQVWESVDSFDDLNGYSIEDARTAEAKRKIQKKENRLLDIRPETKMTFQELSDWYLDLAKIKTRPSYRQIKNLLDRFNFEYGNMIISKIEPAHLESLQIKRKKSGCSDAYIDDEIGRVKSMIKKAFENSKVSGDCLRPFMAVDKLLKHHSNARDRVLTWEEYERLLTHAAKHLKPILIMGYWTGMREGEILNLSWDKVDMKNRMIHLENEDTKEGKAKSVPMGSEVSNMLRKFPQPIHGGHVFLYQGKPITNIRKALQTACGAKKANITYGRKIKDGFVFHDLRHTFVTDIRKAGVSKKVRSSITGHAIGDMDDRYNKVDDQDKYEAIKKLEVYRQGVSKTVSKTANE